MGACPAEYLWPNTPEGRRMGFDRTTFVKYQSVAVFMADFYIEVIVCYKSM